MDHFFLMRSEYLRIMMENELGHTPPTWKDAMLSMLICIVGLGLTGLVLTLCEPIGNL